MRSWMSYGGAYPLLSNRSVAIQTISLLLVFLAPLLGVRGSVAGAQDTAQALVTPETRRAVDRGLEFLLDRQFPDGSLSRDSRDGNAHPGISALAGMALLASGSTPVRGPYRGAVNRITGYLLKVCDRRTGIIADTLTQGEPMYAHTFATLYLAEVCGEDPRPEVRAAVKRAVDLILRAQRPGGGWRYRVQGRDADVSVTACALMALRGARAAGIRVPPRAVRRALQYVLSCAKPDGSFQYQAEGGHASFQLTAAALTALFAVGAHDAAEVEAGLGYMNTYRVDRGVPIIGHFFYGHYYAVQAAYQARGAYFRDWYRPLRSKLIREQEKDGRWRRSTVGDVYATAMAVLILAVPYHHLPITVR